MSKIMLSVTGIINGRGSSKYRWVSGLTKAERDHVKSGGIVLIRDTCKHYMCTPFKRVTYFNGRYSHKNYYGEYNG